MSDRPLKQYQINDPDDLPKANLVRILRDLQYFVYWDEDSGQMFLNPGKEVSGADLGQFIDELMQQHELYPRKFGPKDWSPKKRR
jgi:hypothetical protein